MNLKRLSNEDLVRQIRNTRKLLRKPVIAFRSDWDSYFDRLADEARSRNLFIKGVTAV